MTAIIRYHLGWIDRCNASGYCRICIPNEFRGYEKSLNELIKGAFVKRIFLVIAVVGSFNVFAQETPMSVGARNCAEHVAKKVSFTRPDLVSIGEPAGGRVELVKYYDQNVPGRKFTVPANGRNWVCITSEDGRRILQSN